MEKSSKIFVAGHKGMLGSALAQTLLARGFDNLITRSRDEVDLCDFNQVQEFFEEQKPEYVYLAGAKVGGIYANDTYPADFIYQNLSIQNNVMHCAYLNSVKRLIWYGSSCIYPKLAEQPIKEESLLSGLLERTNEPYAVAKIAGIKMCEAYNRQYGCDFRTIMPPNLYGPGDNYHDKNSHVMAALIKKTHKAKIENAESIEVWGTGSPRREFMFINDLVDASLFLMNVEKMDFDEVTGSKPYINVGVEEEVSILNLAEIISNVLEYKGEFVFNTNMPDGTPRKKMDITKIKKLGWSAGTGLNEGINMAYKSFLENEHD